MLPFQAVDTFGGIDILVSNAAVNPAVGPVLDVSIWNGIFIGPLKQYTVQYMLKNYRLGKIYIFGSLNKSLDMHVLMMIFV